MNQIAVLSNITPNLNRISTRRAWPLDFFTGLMKMFKKNQIHLKESKLLTFVSRLKFRNRSQNEDC